MGSQKGPFHGELKPSDTTMSISSQGKQMRGSECGHGLWFSASLTEVCVADNIKSCGVFKGSLLLKVSFFLLSIFYWKIASNLPLVSH